MVKETSQPPQQVLSTQYSVPGTSYSVLDRLRCGDRSGRTGSAPHHSQATTRHLSLTAHHSLFHRGFTLIEVLLSLTLTLILMLALYAALRLHLRMAQKGPEVVARAQLARVVLQRIARDVRATIPQAVVTSSGTSSAGSAAGSSGTASSSSASSSSSTGGSSTGSQSDTPTFGVLGASDWVDLYVAQQRPNLDDVELAGVAVASNVQRVTYALTTLNTTADAKGRSSRQVIARTQIAAVAGASFDATSRSGTDDTDYRAATDILCDDVGQLQFQYWDDSVGAWVDSWGTDTPIAPPRAIKVTVSLLSADEFLNSQLGVSGSQSTWNPNFELVIPIPAWAPDESSSGSGSSGSTTSSSTTGG